MADLGQLLGALLASLAHARRIADEETTAIAEHYKDHPLLEGLSLPRIRVPEMVLEMPMLIESQDEGEANTLEDTDTIVTAVGQELEDSAKREKVFKQIQSFIDPFKVELERTINKLRQTPSNTARLPKEVIIRAVDNSFSRLVRRVIVTRTRRRTVTSTPQITPEQIKSISSDLRAKANEVALKEVGRPPTISASIITSEIKDSSGSANVSRLRIVMKEEGLEWSLSEGSDGTRNQSLTPE